MAIAVPVREQTPLSLYVRALGVRVGDLAEVVMVNANYLSSVITGKATPSRRLRRSISDALSVPESTLWPEEDPR